MSLLQELQMIANQAEDARQPTDYCTGTVTATSPLEIRQDVHQAPLRAGVLMLTEAVVEKKIPILQHTHTIPEGNTGQALLTSEIICQEDGKALPVEGGYIILNRALAVGDRVLLLRVARGQKFIVLSRIFEA